MTERLKWEKGSVEGWLVAYPDEGNTQVKASIHEAEGRTHGPNWIWNVRVGMSDHEREAGASFSRQEASDAANEAWQRLKS